MKKIIVTLLIVVLCLGVFAGCGEKAPETNLSGDVGTILDTVNKNSGIEYMVENMEIDPATENLNGPLYQTGLSTDEYAKYVTSGFASQAMIMAQAHSVVVLECVDSASALTVQKAMFENKNLPRKWVCVTPEKVISGVSANYVIFIMSDASGADALYDAFAELAGTVGDKMEFVNEEMGFGGDQGSDDIIYQ